MGLKIYNTETAKKEDFVPIKEGEVKMYVCGPTVYNLLHVGNFRGPIFFNTVRNWLEKSGYKVEFAYNYTDVEDRIIDRAIKDGVESSEISEKYIVEFEKDYKSLGLSPHTYNPKVTDHMDDIIKMIEELIAKGRAYEVNGEVLYAIDKFPEYGKLSHRSVDDMRAGNRIDVDDKKKNPLDFALWKPWKEGEPFWESPWGKGRPGWHIECSAMNRALFGDSIDIHGGGLDLAFPHHENEIAQSEGCTDKRFVRYWMHNNMVNFGGQKMAKSVGNIVTGREFVEQYNAEILKFMILSNHYRSEVDLSDEAVFNAISGLARIYKALRHASEFVQSDAVDQPVDGEFAKVLTTATDGMKQAFDDDFNTPVVYSHMFDVVRAFNASFKRGQKVKPQLKSRAKSFLAWMEDLSGLLALFSEEPKSFLQALDKIVIEKKKIDVSAVEDLIRQRTEARGAKDFAKADEVRDKIDAMGVEIYDTPDGTEWEVKK